MADRLLDVLDCMDTRAGRLRMRRGFSPLRGALSIYYPGYSLHGIHLNAANSTGDFDRVVQRHKGSLPPVTTLRDFALIRRIEKNALALLRVHA